MKKLISITLCILILTLLGAVVYAAPQGYTDAVISKMDSIEQSEAYMDGHAYFTDVNNDGTDEVILIHFEGLPYIVSLNSYAPGYNLSENEICSEEVYYTAYSFSGNVCIGDVSIYKDGDFLTFKDTTFITHGLPSGEPSPTRTAVYKKYKIGAKGEIIFVSQASWSYYEESDSYYTKRGSSMEEGETLSTKSEADAIIAEFEKGVNTLLYTVDFEYGDGVTYSSGVLTFEQAAEKLKSENSKELVPEETEESTTEPSTVTTEESSAEETTIMSEPQQETATDHSVIYILLVITTLLAIVVVTIILIIVIKQGKRKQ